MNMATMETMVEWRWKYKKNHGVLKIGFYPKKIIIYIYVKKKLMKF